MKFLKETIFSFLFSKNRIFERRETQGPFFFFSKIDKFRNKLNFSSIQIKCENKHNSTMVHLLNYSRHDLPGAHSPEFQYNNQLNRGMMLSFPCGPHPLKLENPPLLMAFILPLVLPPPYQYTPFPLLSLFLFFVERSLSLSQ